MLEFLLVPGIPAEDLLCVPEPDEDERLSSGLDGDETSHKQVSVEGRFRFTPALPHPVPLVPASQPPSPFCVPT